MRLCKSSWEELPRDGVPPPPNTILSFSTSDLAGSVALERSSGAMLY